MKLPVPEFKVLMLPVTVVMVVNTAVSAFKILVAKFPATVRLDAVVEASVEEPETVRFVPKIVCSAPVLATKLASVVDPSVDEPTVKKLAATRVPVFVDEPTLSVSRFPFCATKFASVVDASVVLPAVKFVATKFVLVPFVSVAFVADNDIGLRTPILKFVIVALVIVAFVPIALIKFDVDALVVDANNVAN